MRTKPSMINYAKHRGERTTTQTSHTLVNYVDYARSSPGGDLRLICSYFFDWFTPIF